MRLILLRHGETEEEKAGIILGHIPGTLSGRGEEQARENAAVIFALDLHPEIIISSDLARAAAYATIIGRELNLKVEFDPLTRERGAGKAEGKSQNKIDWEEYEKTVKPLRRHIGGESFKDVSTRAKEFLKKLSTLPYHTIIIVSHSVFLAMLAVEINDWSLEKALSYDFRNPLAVDTKN